jgi:hypothetical protein
MFGWSRKVAPLHSPQRSRTMGLVADYGDSDSDNDSNEDAGGKVRIHTPSTTRAFIFIFDNCLIPVVSTLGF